MSADFFAYAIAYVLKNEGGAAFVNASDDAGGPTKFGVCQVTLSHWRLSHLQPAATEDDVRNLPEEEAEQIYRILYWAPVHGHQIINQAVACAMLDVAVLCGVGTATKLAQGVLGLEQDGIFGPKTLAAINSHAPGYFLPLFVAALKEHLYRIVHFKPSQAKFWQGWVARANRLLNLPV